MNILQYVTNYGSKSVFRTNCGAPNYQLVTFDLSKPISIDHETQIEPWPMTTLIEEHSKNVLEWAKCVNKDKLIICYMEDVKNVMNVHDLDSGEFSYNIPLDIGSIVGLSGEKHQTEVFYKFSSMITPGITYYMDMKESSPTPQVRPSNKQKKNLCLTFIAD